jgi:hypothetical protein
MAFKARRRQVRNRASGTQPPGTRVHLGRGLQAWYPIGPNRCIG